MSASQIASCLDAASAATHPVTWAIAAERLSALTERRPGDAPAAATALDVPPSALESRQSLRRLLAAARASAPGLDTARVRGTLPDDLRRLLADAGIAVLIRDRLEPATRGERRPAPQGWPCRSILWGLWEVVASDAGPPGMLGRLLPWTASDRPQPGGLAVVDLAGAAPTPGSIRDRFERWLAWGRRQAKDAVEVAPLAALPALIAGAARRPLSGSVLKAA